MMEAFGYELVSRDNPNPPAEMEALMSWMLDDRYEPRDDTFLWAAKVSEYGIWFYSQIWESLFCAIVTVFSFFVTHAWLVNAYPCSINPPVALPFFESTLSTAG